MAANARLTEAHVRPDGDSLQQFLTIHNEKFVPRGTLLHVVSLCQTRSCPRLLAARALVRCYPPAVSLHREDGFQAIAPGRRREFKAALTATAHVGHRSRATPASRQSMAAVSRARAAPAAMDVMSCRRATRHPRSPVAPERSRPLCLLARSPRDSRPLYGREQPLSLPFESHDQSAYLRRIILKYQAHPRSRDPSHLTYHEAAPGSSTLASAIGTCSA